MIEAICKDCGAIFTAPVILGITACPQCGSEDTYCDVDGKPGEPIGKEAARE